MPQFEMQHLASEIYTLDIILAKFITTSWTFSIPVANTFFDAFTAEKMVAPRKRNILEPVLTYRAP